MKLLLDTHIWLWMLTEPHNLRPEVQDQLAQTRDGLFFSAASAWEISIKYHIGKLPLPEHPRLFIPSRLVRDRITPLPVELTHAVEVAGLPDHHTDPFDRLLIAQARVEGLTLVTGDFKLKAYDVPLLWAV